jgi:hypothetical protein
VAGCSPGSEVEIDVRTSHGGAEICRFGGTTGRKQLIVYSSDYDGGRPQVLNTSDFGSVGNSLSGTDGDTTISVNRTQVTLQRSGQVLIQQPVTQIIAGESDLAELSGSTNSAADSSANLPPACILLADDEASTAYGSSLQGHEDVSFDDEKGTWCAYTAPGVDPQTLENALHAPISVSVTPIGVYQGWDTINGVIAHPNPTGSVDLDVHYLPELGLGNNAAWTGRISGSVVIRFDEINVAILAYYPYEPIAGQRPDQTAEKSAAIAAARAIIARM